MRAQPFAYFKESVSEAAVVFPTLSSTLVDYWMSDRGITLSGTNVIEWEGQENGNILEDVGTGPTVSGSNAGFNNVDTLTFDGSSSGLGKIFNNLGGTNTGDVYMMMYCAPHPAVGGGWGAIHGFSGLQGTADFPEAIMRGQTSSIISVWINPDIQSNDDTYGKGIYTVAVGDNDPNGMTFFNKNTTTTNAAGIAGSYKTGRQGYTIGTYNIDLGGQLNGKVDVAALAIFTNPPDAAARINDMAAVDNYFSSIYG